MGDIGVIKPQIHTHTSMAGGETRVMCVVARSRGVERGGAPHP